MANTVKVQGARELEHTCRDAGDSLEDMTRAHGTAGNYVARLAKGKAPVRSGTLANSIRAVQAPTQVAITAGGPGIPYAGPIHWGWPARNISAQPFLTDALAEAETSVQEIYADDVRRTVATIHGK